MALVSCESSINSTTPYGTLKDTDTYATLNDASISKKHLYDLMRNNGYSDVLTNIKEQLFSDVLTNSKYFSYSETEHPDEYYQINTNVINAIYGTSTVESYKKLTDKEKNAKIDEYVDTLFNNGTKKDDGTYYTASDIKAISITFTKDSEGDDRFVANFPESFYESYVFEMAMENYAKEQIKNPDSKYYYKNKYVKGDGENDYYIEDDDIRDYYYSTGKEFRNYRGIVIKFASKAQATRIMQKAIGSTSVSSTTTIADYLKIYNLKNVTDEKLTTDNYLEAEATNLSITKKKNRFTANYSAQVQEMFTEMEDGEYLDEPFNLGGTYYLIYRISGEEEVEWENLSETDQNPGDGTTVYDTMLDYLVENKSLSTLVTDLVEDRIQEIVDNDAIEFYDPLMGYYFKNDYEDFSYTKTSNSDYIYKISYNGEEYTYAPQDLYEELEKTSGTSTAVEYLKNKWALSLSKIADLIDDDEYDDYSDSLTAEIKKYNKGKKDISKKLGLETYLEIQYGVTNKAEVLEEKKASMILSKLNSYYGNPAADDGTFDTTSKLFTQFSDIYSTIYDNYFSADISHILISVDEDYTETYSDPDVYKEALAEIDSTLVEEFDKSILNISNAIISEVKILTISKTVTEAFKYIVEAYENNYKIASLSYSTGNDVYWNDLKNEFPIVLTTEDLSTIDEFSASNYVEAFSDRTKELYDKVIDGTFDETVMDEKGCFEFSDTISSIDSLCKTTYGYHLLNIYGTDEVDSAKFLSTSDSKASTDDEYNQYEHLEVVLIPDDADGTEDDDDDPEYVIYANGYSDTDKASASQLFVYFYEETVMGSHTLLKTSVNTAIKTLFADAVTQYTSTNFQNWKYLTYELKDLSFADDSSKKDLYVGTLKRAITGYDASKYALYTDWVDTTKYDWSIDYEFNWK